MFVSLGPPRHIEDETVSKRKSKETVAEKGTDLLFEGRALGEGDVHEQARVAHVNGSCTASVAACHDSHSHTTLLHDWDVAGLIVLIPVHAQQ